MIEKTRNLQLLLIFNIRIGNRMLEPAKKFLSCLPFEELGLQFT